MSGLNGIYDEIVDKIATPKAQLILLEILKRGGKPERVIKACRNALEFLPDDINIRKILAETYCEQGSIEFAEIELEKISKQIDELSFIFKLKSEFFRKEDRLQEAIKSLKLYLAHHSNDQEAAQLLSEFSAPPEGKEPNLPTPTLAEIYYKQGALEEAINMYKQVVKDFPDDEKYKNRLKELKAIMKTKETERSHEAILKEKKIKIIGILERWLTNIEKIRVISLSSQT